MNDTIWMALALARLAVRVEMLEQECAAMRQEAEKAKGLHVAEQPKEKESGN